MAIKAIVEDGRNIAEERLIELAEGERAEDGKPFKIIQLLARGSDRRGAGARFQIKGYQDTFIRVDGQGQIQIRYGDTQGGIMFEKNELGRLVGRVARTDWNMRTLAAEYGDSAWKIMDPEIEAEVREMASKIKTDPATIQHREETSKSKGRAVSTGNAEAELIHKIEQNKKFEALKKKDALKADKLPEEKESFPGKTALLAELADMNYTAIRNRALASGMDKNTTERNQMITAIVKYEASKHKGEIVVE